MKRAFTLAEILIVAVILAIIMVIVSGAFVVNSQRQFDVKFDKISSTLYSNIQRGLVQRTGFNFNDYINHNPELYADVTNNLDGTDVGVTIANCWSNNTILNNVNISGYSAFRMSDETVLAIENDNQGMNIFVDVNGRTGPNEFGRDIFQYNEAVAQNRLLAGGGGNGGGEAAPCVDPGHEETNATWSYDSSTCTWTPSCGSKFTLSGNSCICNLAQKTENNIIYTVDSNCNYQATGCAITTSSNGDFTYSYSLPNCTATKSGCTNGKKTLNSGGACVCSGASSKTENNIIYSMDSNCNYKATACATTTSSNGDFTYSYSLPNCTATKSGCTNTKKKLSGESCVCNDPATKTDATYKYTLDSNCTYQKTGCVNSKKTFNSSSKTCVCSNKSSCNTTTNDFNESNCTCTPNACSTTEINKKLQSANSSCRNAASALIAYCFNNMYSTCTKSCSNASACCSATASYVGMSVAQMIKSGRSVPAACR